MPSRGRKRHALQRHDDMALDQIEAKGAQKMREQNDPLLHREGHADADARPGAERDVGETVDAIAPFAQETGRIERVGLVPEAPAPMQDIGRDRTTVPAGIRAPANSSSAIA